ncbi:MAG: glycoside hydrolase family 3 N-terminal domain-containing protein [Dehalococcoidia bacterium]|nr:glycoside hydrolase family 3 N-terminal domain-containing protein [Dehalococcoidia bacterium]
MYRDPSRPIGERVTDLAGRMTLEEKVAQLCGCWPFELLDHRGLDAERMRARLAHGIGQVSRLAGMSPEPPSRTAELANTIQRFLLESTRLGIPAIFHEECLCGYQARQGTVFPQAIGLAATWDPILVGRMAEIIRQQMVAAGARQALAPVLDIARDPRWGRTEETFGEDPYLVSAMGKAYVKGLQGRHLAEGVMATAKHFIGYGNSEGGLNWAPAHIPARELYEVFARPFEAAIREAGLASVMNAYNEIDGVPCAVSKWLLTDFLRGQLGFEGLVVSDYMAIETTCNYHRVARDLQEAAVQAINAGLDTELPTSTAYAFLADAVRKGMVDIAAIDRSVQRVLEAKFRLGLFENPYVDPQKVREVFSSPEATAVSRRLAIESMTLLKNEGGLLPLRKNLRSIALIGPIADSARCLLGDYNYVSFTEGIVGMIRSLARGLNMDPSQLGDFVAYHAAAFKRYLDTEDEEAMTRENYDMPSILQGIRLLAANGTKVIHARGCTVQGHERSGFDEAVAAAKEAEVAVAILGGKSGLDLTCTSGETRDVASLALPGVQQNLLEAVFATGTPIVLVLVSGRPLAIPWAAEHVPAILQAWLPGQEGGMAVADVLFGNAVPGGKLPISVPRSVGQIPVYHYHKPSGGRSQFTGNYVDLPAQPLYPFGFGLSYTTFAYSNLRMDRTVVDTESAIEISCDVTNVGRLAGDEVVQLYVRDHEAAITRPVRELAGFSRISLNAGETRTVSFILKITQLAFYNIDMELVVEPGKIEVMVGSSSEDIRLRGEFEITGSVRKVEGVRPFTCEVHHSAPR